jgi:hypothetical protein
VGGAVLQNSTVAMYITVYYHQSVRRSSRRTGCCATHNTMYFLSSSINKRGADCAVGVSGTWLCYVYHRVISSTPTSNEV